MHVRFERESRLKSSGQSRRDAGHDLSYGESLCARRRQTCLVILDRATVSGLLIAATALAFRMFVASSLCGCGNLDDLSLC